MKNIDKKEFDAARGIGPDICENVRDDSVRRIYEAELDCILGRPARAEKGAFPRDSSEGIVHEFNNAVTTIAGYAEMSMVEMRDRATLNYYLKQILGAAMRASELASRLVDVCRERAKNEPIIASDSQATERIPAAVNYSKPGKQMDK